VEEFQSAAKSPDSRIEIAAPPLPPGGSMPPLPPGGSTKTATPPKRLGTSPASMTAFGRFFLFGHGSRLSASLLVGVRANSQIGPAAIVDVVVQGGRPSK
jgi:hypothetical protein